jgi:hypothetical protein
VGDSGIGLADTVPPKSSPLATRNSSVFLPARSQRRAGSDTQGRPSRFRVCQ